MRFWWAQQRRIMNFCTWHQSFPIILALWQYEMGSWVVLFYSLKALPGNRWKSRRIGALTNDPGNTHMDLTYGLIVWYLYVIAAGRNLLKHQHCTEGGLFPCRNSCSSAVDQGHNECLIDFFFFLSLLHPLPHRFFFFFSCFPLSTPHRSAESLTRRNK